MMAQDAAAETPGDENRVARPRAAASQRARARSTSPTTVTLITSGPSQLFVSPPAIATS